MKKRLQILIVCMLWATIKSIANDGAYYASGNFLFPLQETTISVRSEVLTISIDNSGYATVDVQYVFDNDGPPKTIEMAFESPLPYNSGSDFSRMGDHPFIRNFTATLNGKSMSCRSAVVVGNDTDINNYRTFSRKWRGEEDFDYGESYITNGEERLEVTAYAYLFKAYFKHGQNTVHHSYRYLTSGGLSANFEIPYILQPCTRWANHQVDDFTLRIATPSTAKHFYLEDDVLRQTPFTVVSGTGKVRAGTIPSDSEEEDAHYQEVSLRNGVVECHIKNFKPETALHILSTDYLLYKLEKKPESQRDLNVYYNRGWMLAPTFYVDFKDFYGREASSDAECDALFRRICRNLPYADRGYVFSDEGLRRFFEAQWWYMPDFSWEMSTKDFTKTDWHYINELGKEPEDTK